MSGYSSKSSRYKHDKSRSHKKEKHRLKSRSRDRYDDIEKKESINKYISEEDNEERSNGKSPSKRDFKRRRESVESPKRSSHHSKSGRSRGRLKNSQKAKRSRDMIPSVEKEDSKQRKEESQDLGVKSEEQIKLEEQEKLDAEMKRRRERVEKWQEQRRKVKEEIEKELDEREKELENKKKWTLEDDDDDDDNNDEESNENEKEENGLPEVKEEVEELKDIAAKEAILKKEKEEEKDEKEVKKEERVLKKEKEVKKQIVMRVEVKKEEYQDEMEYVDIDPLEAFMYSEVMPQVELDVRAAINLEMIEQAAMHDKYRGIVRMEVDEATKVKSKKKDVNPYDSDTSNFWDAEELEDEDDEEWIRNLKSSKLSKGEKLGLVDHSKVEYVPFRKNFYREVSEISKMSEEQLVKFRKELDSLKVRGKNIPNPIKTWSQCGLTTRIMEIMKKRNYPKPLPIQSQALPVIMSGRDALGIAKTGSGKTLAFVLPLLRHVKDQPTVVSGEGPVGLLLAPTRELVQQIGKEIKRFTKVIDLRCTCVFGGTGVANQISELKRSTEIVVCTPGRMIDLLVTSNGKITNLRRVTFLVLDEADRMFDMGFEPQIMKIVNNIRPDRQTVMFSATFPRQPVVIMGWMGINYRCFVFSIPLPTPLQYEDHGISRLAASIYTHSVELLARRILNDPIEIIVGGRSIVNSDITQFVEIRPESERFLRLLEILGEWYEQGKVLVFVNAQEKCDTLFRDLLRHGYPCLSLHGGKEQTDRESTIADFKGDVCNLMIATSVAARGLDVCDLILVVNYDTPNHHEEYIHRVGRTGRAGKKGTSITFISKEDERFAPDLVKALRESHAPIPQDLQDLANGFNTKKKKGLAIDHGSGYGGSGFKFNEVEDDNRRAARKAEVKKFARANGEDDSDDEGDMTQSILESSTKSTTIEEMIKSLPQVQQARQIAEKLAVQGTTTNINISTAFGTTSGSSSYISPDFALIQANYQQQQQQLMENPLVAAAKFAAGEIAAKIGLTGFIPPPNVNLTKLQNNPQAQIPSHFEAELEINDFPQHARWKITHRDTLAMINELTNAAVTIRGKYYGSGTPIPPGERRLYLLIEAESESCIRKAKLEIKKILTETTEKAMRRDMPTTGKYNIMSY